ncbi:hypothetical protein ACFLT4_07610, partial [Chloroflexota bacterium]
GITMTMRAINTQPILDIKSLDKDAIRKLIPVTSSAPSKNHPFILHSFTNTPGCALRKRLGGCLELSAGIGWI